MLLEKFIWGVLFIVMLYVVLRDKLKSKKCFFMKFFVNIL